MINEDEELDEELDESEISHLGCSSYPNCDLAPTGCNHSGYDIEYFGHKN